ncbi:MAG: hypothetical protein FJ118_15765 [Deltaproteobacteria bacterium]|nr:hypothetical protein [Deltaproteobacteria bacterium]
MIETKQLWEEETRKIRLLRVCTDLVAQLLMTRPLSAEEADRLIVGARSFALGLFPDKGHVFDLVYLPRFRRALQEAGARKMPGILRKWEKLTQ